MRQTFMAGFTAAACLLMPYTASAQNYEHKHGYIFEQPYMKPLSLDQAQQLLQDPAMFDKIMQFEWMEDKEAIADVRVKRQGKQLIFEFQNRKPLTLKDFSFAGSPTMEGDAQTFKYLKAYPQHHLVGVIYSNDQPQLLLIEKTGANFFFISTHE